MGQIFHSAKIKWIKCTAQINYNRIGEIIRAEEKSWWKTVEISFNSWGLCAIICILYTKKWKRTSWIISHLIEFVQAFNVLCENGHSGNKRNSGKVSIATSSRSETKQK